MSCILRVSGDELDIDALLKVVDLKPDRVWRRGEPRRATKPNGKRHEDSGITFIASDAELSEFNVQLDEATSFLEEHEVQIAAMVSFDGVQDATLDFGIKLGDVLIHSDKLMPRFLKAVAATGLAVQLSHYLCSEEVAPNA